LPGTVEARRAETVQVDCQALQKQEEQKLFRLVARHCRSKKSRNCSGSLPGTVEARRAETVQVGCQALQKQEEQKMFRLVARHCISEKSRNCSDWLPGTVEARRAAVSKFHQLREEIRTIGFP
jgi:hypothetical protein